MPADFSRRTAGYLAERRERSMGFYTFVAAYVTFIRTTYPPVTLKRFYYRRSVRSFICGIQAFYYPPTHYYH